MFVHGITFTNHESCQKKINGGEEFNFLNEINKYDIIEAFANKSKL